MGVECGEPTFHPGTSTDLVLTNHSKAIKTQRRLECDVYGRTVGCLNLTDMVKRMQKVSW